MDAVDIIRTKRDGKRLSDEQITKIVDYLHELRKQYPDEQPRKPARSGAAGAK